MTIRAVFLACGLFAAGGGLPTTMASGVCAPGSGFQLVCGQTHPEDLVHIPGTRWLIASGFSPGAGVKLVDTESRTLMPALGSAIPASKPDQRAFPNCEAAPDISLLNVQGLSLRPSGTGGHHVLYAVNHGGRESVEVFDVDASGDRPVLSWRGCVQLPSGLAANSVAAYSDGTLLITVLVHPGNTFADFVEGRNTGGVYEWRPGDAQFKLLPGTALPGNNGIETSPDDAAFFVVAFGRHAVLRYRRDAPDQPPVESVAPGFMPDNIHRYGDRYLLAGMMYDEPACGGVRKVVGGEADPMRCHRGTVVAELEPHSMEFSLVAYASPDAIFNGATTAVIVADELWIGSYQSECLAVRSLGLARSREPDALEITN